MFVHFTYVYKLNLWIVWFFKLNNTILNCLKKIMFVVSKISHLSPIKLTNMLRTQ